MRRTNILRIMSLVIGVLLLITLFAFASVEDVGSIGLYQDFDYNNGTQYRMFMNWTGNAKFNYTVLVRSSTTDWSTTGYANVPGTSNNMKYEHKATILNPGVTYDFTLLIVNASNGADSINSSKIASILINDRPTVNNVNITPINPKKTDKITCIANVIDRYQPSTSINAVINLTYGGGEGSGGIQSNVSCPGDGENFTCADTFNLTAEVAYIRGNSVSCVVAVTDGQRNHTNSSVQSALIQNSEPEARDVRIVNNSDTSSTTLFCNYTFYDYDGDTENISSQEFRWLINNEGLNEYVEILGEKEQALQRIFDQNDRIKCSVRIMDDYDDNALVSEWADSSVYMFTENSVPQLVNITDSTSMSSPAEVGQQIVFSGKWFDIQDYPETANMYVCKGIYPPEDMSGNRSDVWVNITYPQGGDDSKAVWVFSNKTGQYVEKISVVPYKFQEGSYSTYADGSFIESGDFDYNSTDGALSLFSAGDNFYDKNRDGRYTVGEPIVNSSADHVYQAGLDNLVTPGYYIPNNAVLTPFNESKHRFKDKNGDGNFSYNATNPEKSEDIYYKLNLTGDVGGIKSIVGDLRLTVVTNSSIEERDYTQNVYDFYVYEVNVTEMEWLRNGIGARPNVSNYVMIANDTDNNFRIGERNYFTFQYNTRPYDSRFLAIKMCIDSDNDGTCDNNDLGDKIVQSVSFTANNSGPGYIVYDNGTRRYNPDITFYYGGNNLETEGCDDEEYCRSNNQTASGIENVLNCSSYAQETDNVTNPYHVKVCDRPGEVDSKCSIYRSGTFYVNHKPETTIPELYFYNITNIGPGYNITSLTASVTDNLFCNATFSDPDNESSLGGVSWLVVAGENNLTYEWSRKVKGSMVWNRCIPEDITCPTNSSSLLPFVLTGLGDEWRCEVTPHDAHTTGFSKTSVAVKITDTGALPGTAPQLINTTDSVNSELGEVIYPGEYLNITMNFRDIDSTNLRVYVCNYSINATAGEEIFVHPSGCLKGELYRGFATNSDLGEIIEHTVSYQIPTNYKNTTYNYTVVLYDEYQQGTNTSIEHNVANGTYTVAPLPNVTDVYLTTTAGNISSSVVNDSVNLICNYTYVIEGVTHRDDDSVFKNVTYIWQSAVSGSSYYFNLSVGNKTKILSNALITEGFLYRCSITVPQPRMRGLTTKFSDPVLVRDPVDNNEAPNLINVVANGQKTTAVNVGSNITFRIYWNDSDDTSTKLYICDNSSIGTTGCYGRTLAERTLTENIVDVTYNLTSSEDFKQGVSISVCDDSFNCSGVVNRTIYVNHAPSSSNVEIRELNIPGQGQVLYCNYAYNEGVDPYDDEDIIGLEVRWYAGSDDNLLQIGNSQIFATGENTGLIYCKVRTKDIFGLRDSDLRTSFNAVYIEAPPEAATIWNTHMYTNKSTYNIYGRVPYNFTQIIVYVYNGSNRFDFRNASYQTNLTSKLIGTTYASISREINDSLIAIPRNHSLLFNQSQYSEWSVEFGGHISRYHQRYNVSWMNNTAQDLILNLTSSIPKLNTSVALYEEISIYDTQYPTGWFNISIDLYNNSNWIELYTINLATNATSAIQTVFQSLVLDTESPIVTARDVYLSNISQTFFFNITDNRILDMDTLFVNVTNASNAIQYYEYTTTSSDLSCTVSDDDVNATCNLELQNIDTGDWKITIRIADKFPNVNISTYYAYFRSQSPVVNNITIYDGVTNNATALETSLVNVSWNITQETRDVGVEHFNITLFLENTTTVVETQNMTANMSDAIFTTYFTTDLVNGTNYRVGILALSNTGVWGTYNYSNSLRYTLPSIPMLTVLRVENTNITAEVNGQDYYIDMTNTLNTTIVFNTTTNVTCYATEERMPVSLANGSANYTADNIGEGINITFTFNTSEEGLYEYYIICEDIVKGYQQPELFSSKISWRVDYQAPSIRLVSPVNSTLQNETFTLTAVIEENGTSITNVTYSIAEVFNATILANGTLSSTNNIYTLGVDPTLYAGVFNITINATDALGNSTMMNWLFVNKTSMPNIQHNIPTYFGDSLNFTLIITEFVNVSYTLYERGLALVSSYEVNNTEHQAYYKWPINIDTSGYDNVTYVIDVTAIDANGNRVNIEQNDDQYLIYLDTDVPIFANATNTTNTSFYRSQNISLNITARDNYGIRDVLLEHNATGAKENITAESNGTLYTATIYSNRLENASSIGWKFYMIDLAGQKSNTSLENLALQNRDPVWDVDMPRTFVWESTTINAPYYDFGLYVSDEDGDRLTLNVTNAPPPDVAFTKTSRMRVFGNGEYTLQMLADDQFGGESYVNITVKLFAPNDMAACSATGTKVGFSSLDCPTTTPTPPSPGSGGGGGGSGSTASYMASDSVLSHGYNLVNPLHPAIFNIRSNVIPLESLMVFTNHNLTNVKLTINRSLTVPAGASQLESKYSLIGYLKVDGVNIEDSQISKAQFTLKVNESLFDGTSTLRFLEYTDTWKELTPVYLKTEGGFKYYEVSANKLGIFAIAFAQPDMATTNNPTPTGNVVKETPKATCHDNILNQNEEDVDCGGLCVPCSEPILETPTPTTSSGNAYIGWLFAFIIAIFIVGGSAYYVLQNKKPELQSGAIVTPEEPKIESLMKPMEALQKYEITPGMNELQIYIRRQLNKGISIEIVREALIKAQWKRTAVIKECDAIEGAESTSELFKSEVDDSAPEMEMSIEDMHPLSEDIYEAPVPITNETPDNILANLQDYAANLVFEGNQKDSVVAKLQTQGWDEEYIDGAITHIDAIEDLKQTVGRWEAQGYTKEQIKEHLMSLGWSIYIVYELLK